MLPRSPIVKKCLLLVLVLGGLVAFSYTIGADTTIGSTTKLTVEKARFAVEEQLHKLKVLDKLSGLFDKAPKKGPADDQLSIRDACLEAMFFEQADAHFSQSRWGAIPMPYQFMGLEVTGPEPLPLSEADSGNGIDERVYYQIHVESYRSFEEGTGWSEWKFDQPPKLDGLTLIRQNGHWKVSTGANRAYSIH